jgi:hypothetical protein
VDATGEVAQLGHRPGRLLDHGVQPRGQLAGFRRGLPGHPRLEHQVGQPLLGAVVKVPLDAPAGLVCRRDDPGPR